MIAPLNRVLSEFDITSPLRQAAFLAQIGHESADLRCWEELSEKCEDLSSMCCYSGGCKFLGRGPIQLTHDYNYQAAQRALALSPDISKYPDRVKTDILTGFRTSAWFWTERAIVNGRYQSLNSQADLADVDKYAFGRITRGIWGKCNAEGHTPRVTRYCRARVQLGLDAPGTQCNYDRFPCPPG